MSTVYEVNGPGYSIQISKDLVFGWCIRTNEEGYDFEMVSGLDQEQLGWLRAMSWPAYIPEEFIEAVRAA